MRPQLPNMRRCAPAGVPSYACRKVFKSWHTDTLGHMYTRVQLAERRGDDVVAYLAHLNVALLPPNTHSRAHTR